MTRESARLSRAPWPTLHPPCLTLNTVSTITCTCAGCYNSRTTFWPAHLGRSSSMANVAPLARQRLPSGIVTFLFTDIEGSTKRWEQYPQEMDAALGRHDEIRRRGIEANGGYVFKTVADAFCAAFPTPDCALAAALAAQ